MKPRLIVLVLLLVGVLFFGTAGYMIIERWTFLDALYMTVITLASVGYGEVRKLDTPGRVFTIVLIVSGIGTLAFCLQTLIARIVEMNVLGDLRKRRLSRMMEQLSGHIVLCGYGRVGKHVAGELGGHGKTFVLIDRDVVEENTEEYNTSFVIRGDATDESLLIRGGIERASTLISVVGSDADNLFIIMTARALNPGIHIICRAADKSSEGKLRRAGADRVVCPYEIGGRRIVSFIIEPSVSEFLDSITASKTIELRLQEIRLTAGGRLEGRTLSESRIREESGAIILAMKKTDGTLSTNPEPRTVMQSGDILIALGTLAQLESLRRLAGKEA